MKLIRNSVWIAVVLGLFSSAAFAVPRLSVVGAVNSSKVDVDVGGVSATGLSSKTGFGGGALLEFSAAPMLGIELGALYVLKKYGDSVGTELTYPYFQVPLVFRLHLGRYVSVGAGGYYAMGVGDVKSKLSGSTVELSSSYDAAGFKKSDYGVTGSFALHLPLGMMTSLLIDGRYNYGLANVLKTAPANTNYKWREMQGLIGLTFGMMK